MKDRKARIGEIGGKSGDMIPIHQNSRIARIELDTPHIISSVPIRLSVVPERPLPPDLKRKDNSNQPQPHQPGPRAVPTCRAVLLPKEMIEQKLTHLFSSFSG